MSLNYLSQVINQQTGKNFFDFINSYRITEATTILSEDVENRQNILNLAMSVGFNSKSAFYNAFKKHTGMTPTQYRAQLTTERSTA
jgi:AraC-like DNA-binding protein